MKNYSDYAVPCLNNFADALLYSKRLFADRVLFAGRHGDVTYRSFIDQTDALISYFNKFDNKVFVLDLSGNSIKFLSCLFAVVVSGNKAVLGNCREFVCLNGAETVMEETVDKLLPVCSVQVEYKNRTGNGPNILLFSSGTTREPKGIMLDDKKIVTDTLAGMRKYRYDSDVLVNIIPFSHAFGLVCDFMGPFLSGGKVCLPDSPLLFQNCLQSFQPTMLNLPPSICKLMLKRMAAVGKEATFGARLKKILCGGAGVSAELQEEYYNCGILLFGCYGLTECSPCVSVNRDRYYKFGSSGILLDCNHISFSAEGEVLINGENLAYGYLHPDGRKTLFGKDEFFNTSDLGFMDDDGFLYITGRKDNLIVLNSGIKIQPEIYEDKIEKLKGVSEALVVYDPASERLLCCYSAESAVDENAIWKVFDGLPLKNIIKCRELKKNKLGKKLRDIGQWKN